MFSLISGLIKYFFSKTEIRILILGLDYAGKTTLLERTKSVYRKSKNSVIIPPEKITPTIGLNISTVEISRCMVLFWDVSGQIKMRTIWQHYYADANGLIFVIDSTDMDRLEEARLALESVLEHPHIRKIPLLVLVNKQDLPGALSAADLQQTILNFLSPDQIIEINGSTVINNDNQFNSETSSKSHYPSLDELELVVTKNTINSQKKHQPYIDNNSFGEKNEAFSPSRNYHRSQSDELETQEDPLLTSSSATLTYSNHRDRMEKNKQKPIQFLNLQSTPQISKRSTPNNRSQNKIKEINSNTIDNKKDLKRIDRESKNSSLPLKAKQSPSFPALGFGEKVYKFDKSGALDISALSENQNHTNEDGRNFSSKTSFQNAKFTTDGKQYGGSSSSFGDKKFRKVRLQECSAITGFGIEEGIKWIVEQGKTDARELLI